MQPRPGALRVALGLIQRDIEKLLNESPQATGPTDILELVADAFHNSGNKACAEEVRDLLMRLRELQLGCPKISYLS